MHVMSSVDVEAVQRSLAHDGYAVIKDVVAKAGLSELSALLAQEYEQAKATGGLFQGGGSVSGHLNCFPGERSRFVYDDIRRRGILDVVRSIDPEAVDDVRVTMNYNLPGSAPQFYHSDGLYTDAFLICNVAVVDTNLTNGAMDVLPGTNREFYKFWRYALERKYRLTTRVCLEQGDVLLRVSTLWHRGMPNLSQAPRPLMSLTFGEKGRPEGDPFMVNDGKVAFYPNWFNTNRLGRLRERSFVSLPWTYSAYRFARSLYGNKGYSSW